jgi:hypothetical protein
MHRNTAVASVNIHEKSGMIESVSEIFACHHMPVGTYFPGNETDAGLLNKWWIGRSIPASRTGLADALVKLGMESSTQLMQKSYGLSLSDGYWICPENVGLKWSEINFFENNFSKDVGEILFGTHRDSENISLYSPDNTADGTLRKRWVMADGKRYLMKGGSGRRQQEPFNELVAAAICRRLKIPHASYTLTFENGNPYSLSENFITENTELVPFAQINRIKPLLDDDKFAHTINCAEKLGLENIRAGLDRMMVLDFIIMNEDRHFNNFGAVRDSETLEWKGFAPIYDSGNSLWYTSDFIGEPIASKPFRASHGEQIKLVSDFSWYDENELVGLFDEMEEIFAKADGVRPENKAEIIKHTVLRAKAILEIVEKISNL